MQQLNKTLVEFNHYINGGSPKRLKYYMRCYKDNLYYLNEHCNTAINQPGIINQIQKILKDLAVPRAQWANYLNPPLTLYDWLLKLHQEGYIQIGYIIQLINSKLSIPKRVYLVATFFVSSLILGLLSNANLSLLVITIQNFLKSPIGYPILGIALSLGLACFSLYRSFSNYTKPKAVRIRDSLFTVMYTMLNILGYSLLIQSKIAMTPLAAGVFILGSFSDVIKESLALVQGYWRYHYGVGGKGVGYLYSIRSKYSFIKHRNAAWINLIMAAAIVVIMVAWCMMPSNTIITITAIAIMSILYTIKAVFIKINEHKIRQWLQKEIKEIHTVPSDTNEQLDTRSKIIRNINLAVNSVENPNKLLGQFIDKYEKTKAFESKIGFFKLSGSSRFDYSNATLTDILTHALLEEGLRTRKVLLELKWINKYQEITLPAAHLTALKSQKPDNLIAPVF